MSASVIDPSRHPNHANQPRNVVFLIGFVAYVVIRGVFDRRSKNVETTINKSDRRDRLLIVIMLIGGILLPVIYVGVIAQTNSGLRPFWGRSPKLRYAS